MAYGARVQTRSFFYVDAMIRDIFSVLLSREVEPINLVKPNETYLLELAQEIKALT